MAISAATVQYGPWLKGVRYDQPAEDLGPNALFSMTNCRGGQAGQVLDLLVHAVGALCALLEVVPEHDVAVHEGVLVVPRFAEIDRRIASRLVRDNNQVLECVTTDYALRN